MQRGLMNPPRSCLRLLLLVMSCLAWSLDLSCSLGADLLPAGWQMKSPRDELRPEFLFEARGGRGKSGAFKIFHDGREGLDGWYEKTFEVHGGDFVRFGVWRRTKGVESPRRSALVRIRWQDSTGSMVSAQVPSEQVAELGHVPSAEPEHPVDVLVGDDGWTKVGGSYRVPPRATQAIVELHLQWAPKGRVEWCDVEWSKIEKPEPRPVRLGTVHYKPKGKSPKANCEEYVPFIEEAAKQRADLVVLGETVTSVGLKTTPQDIAEPIPGPTTEFFGDLARKHRLHLVLSLNERDRHLVYNTAVLLGPDGILIGKYRKVCLPHGEVESGVAPGRDYPVFQTVFGKVGMMICYDGFFPEVARELSRRGAEVIAWPVYGCNPVLGQARAAENHVYVVSSTFMQPKDGWMISAVFGPSGKPIAKAETWGSVVVTEVDLGQPYIGPWNLGDFHSMVPRHRPVTVHEGVMEGRANR